MTQYADSPRFQAAHAYRVKGSESGDIDTGQNRPYDRYVLPLRLLLHTFCDHVGGINLLRAAQRSQPRRRRSLAIWSQPKLRQR